MMNISNRKPGISVVAEILSAATENQIENCNSKREEIQVTVLPVSCMIHILSAVTLCRIRSLLLDYDMIMRGSNSIPSLLFVTLIQNLGSSKITAFNCTLTRSSQDQYVTYCMCVLYHHRQSQFKRL